MTNLQHDENSRNICPLIVGNLPRKLTYHRQFIVWRYENHGGKKPDKVPYNPRTGERASVSDPQTWASLAEALAAYQAEPWDGIGFVFTESDPFVGIDLDKCCDPLTGEREPWVRTIIERVPSYWEASPSGTGLHAIVEMTAPLPKHGRKKGKVEMYSDKRFFTLTGHHIDGTAADVTECTQAALTLHSEVFGPATEQERRSRPHTPNPLSDGQLLLRARNARNGAKFAALFDRGETASFFSHSEADLALCSHLAFYCGDDPERIDRLFRRSGLYRKKWDRKDYAQRTIQKALDSCTATASPKPDALIARATAFIESYEWKGVAATSARLVLIALLQIMQETGKEEISADCRTVAELTGMTFGTVAKALRRLSGVRKDVRADVPVVLVRVEDKRTTGDLLKPSRRAYRYRINESAIGTQSKTPLASGVCECVSFAHVLATVSHDAFRKRGRGLTRSAALVYAALPCGSVAEIANATRLSRRTVYNALHTLHGEGLVTQDGSKAWGRTDESLATVAKRRGTAGAGEQQRMLHKIQRDNFAAWLARPQARKTMNAYVLHPEGPEPEPPEPDWSGDWWRQAA